MGPCISMGVVYWNSTFLFQVTSKQTSTILKTRLSNLASSSTCEEVVLNILSVIGLSCHGILLLMSHCASLVTNMCPGPYFTRSLLVLGHATSYPEPSEIGSGLLLKQASPPARSHPNFAYRSELAGLCREVLFLDQ
jgi:hypothetical protein